MSASLAGFLTLPEAIQRIGPRVQADWTGSEHVAPSARDDAAKLLEVFELDAAQLEREEAAWVRKIMADAKEQRAAGAPRSGIAEAIPKLLEIIEKTNDPTTRARLERFCEFLKNSKNKRYRGRRLNAEARANNIRHRLVEEAFDRQEANAARRQRWNRVHAVIRDKVFAGDLEAAPMLPNGEVVYPTAEHWKAAWPAAGEALARVPHLGCGWPAEVLFAVGDFDNTFRKDTPAEAAAQAQPAPARNASIATRGQSGPRTGPKTRKTQKMADDLLRKLRDKTLTTDALEKTSGLALGMDYRLGETSALKARKSAITLFRANTIVGKTD